MGPRIYRYRVPYPCDTMKVHVLLISIEERWVYSLQANCIIRFDSVRAIIENSTSAGSCDIHTHPSHNRDFVSAFKEEYFVCWGADHAWIIDRKAYGFSKFPIVPLPVSFQLTVIFKSRYVFRCFSFSFVKGDIQN